MTADLLPLQLRDCQSVALWYPAPLQPAGHTKPGGCELLQYGTGAWQEHAHAGHSYIGQNESLCFMLAIKFAGRLAEANAGSKVCGTYRKLACQCGGQLIQRSHCSGQCLRKLVERSSIGCISCIRAVRTSANRAM